MKVLVCFKIVKDMDYVIDRDWEIANSSEFELSYVKDVISCFDESALENALRLKDSARLENVQCDITALTIGDGNYDNFVKNLFAVGISEVVQVKGCGELDFQPELVSEIIAKTAVNKFDLILLGNEDSTSNCGITGFHLANKLNVPYILSANEITYNNGELKLTKIIDDGLMFGKITGDCVVSFSNSNNPYLRFSTLRDRLKVSLKTAQVVEFSDLNLSNKENDLKLVSLKRENKDLNCKMLVGNLQENVQFIMDNILNEVVK